MNIWVRTLRSEKDENPLYYIVNDNNNGTSITPFYGIGSHVKPGNNISSYYYIDIKLKDHEIVALRLQDKIVL